MLKRTKGRILLALLVVTGFAGTVNNTAPTKEERRFAIDHLKDTKAELQKSLKGLSKAQLDFKPSPRARSIRECFFHLAMAESESWKMLELAMKEPALPEERSELKFFDETLVNTLPGNMGKMKTDICFSSEKGSWKSMAEAQAAFKLSRTQYLKYIKTTTEDLRNHFISLPFGTVDCYQFILLISAHSDLHQEEIRGILSHTSFPGK